MAAETKNITAGPDDSPPERKGRVEHEVLRHADNIIAGLFGLVLAADPSNTPRAIPAMVKDEVLRLRLGMTDSGSQLALIDRIRVEVPSVLLDPPEGRDSHPPLSMEAASALGALRLASRDKAAFSASFAAGSPAITRDPVGAQVYAALFRRRFQPAA